jgi:hypothetical protein
MGIERWTRLDFGANKLEKKFLIRSKKPRNPPLLLVVLLGLCVRHLAANESPAARKNAIMAVLQTSDRRTANIDGHMDDGGAAP